MTTRRSETSPDAGLPSTSDGGYRGKRAYDPPRLEVLGDVRDLTLAGISPGIGDSGYPNTYP
jgi:hypothetical protein